MIQALVTIVGGEHSRRYTITAPFVRLTSPLITEIKTVRNGCLQSWVLLYVR